MRLDITEIPIPRGDEHPKPCSDLLPKHEFTMGIIAPKGQGKTTLLINFILFYKNYFNQIIILSPTIKNDPKWEYLFEQDILVENVALRKLLQELKDNPKVREDIIQERPDQLTDQDLCAPTKIMEKTFSKKIDKKNCMTDYDEHTINGILNQQQHMIDLLSKLGKSKYIADRLLLVCDDMVGSELFSGARSNLFKKANSNHRHFSLSILMITQA